MGIKILIEYQNNPNSFWYTLEDLEGEVWKNVVGGEGYYLVSNWGRVKGVPNTTIRNYKSGKIEPYTKPVKIIKPGYNRKGGYYILDLNIDGKRVNRLVHRLVAKAFIPNTYSKEQVNHINGVHEDNRVCNLEWATPSET